MHGGGRAQGLERVMAAWGRRKWLALLVFTMTAAAAVTAVMSLPDVYRASATVLVEQSRTDPGSPAELDTRLQLINQEILSRSRLESLVATYGLYPHLRGRASSEALAARMRRDIRTEFKSLPQASGPGSTIGFTLAYRGPDPRAVAQVANALASFYVEQDAKLRERQTSGAVTVLDAQLADMKRDLLAQERVLAEFQEQHRGELPQYADANLAAMERLHADLRAVSEQKARALDRRDALVSRQAEEETGKAPPADPVAARRAKLEQELGELRQRFSEKHPDVIQKRAELAALGERQDVAPAAPAPPRARAAAADVEEEIRGYRAEEARLRGEIAAYAQRLDQAPLRQRDLQAITRDYQSTRDLYDSLRKRYEQAQLESGLSAEQAGPRFSIVDPAVVPTDTVAPNLMVLLLVELCAAGATAAAAAALAEALDGSFHSADDVAAFTRVPVLASIPLIVTAGDRRRSRLRAALVAAALVLGVAGLVHAAHRVARGQETLVAMLARS